MFCFDIPLICANFAEEISIEVSQDKTPLLHSVLKWRPLRSGIPLAAIAAITALVGCGSSKDIPEGSYSLEKTTIESRNKEIDPSTLTGYIRQKPNTKLFSLFKKPGASSVVYDTLLTQQSADDIRDAVQNMGYLHAGVSIENKTKGNKVATKYVIDTGEPYYISRFKTNIQDEGIAELLDSNKQVLAPLHAGRRFSVTSLNDTRNKVTTLLNNNGYYHFNKDFIDFDVDTAANSTDVGVKMSLYRFRNNSSEEDTLHRQYRIRNISYSGGEDGQIHIRQKVLDSNTALKEGALYSSKAMQSTYNNFSYLQAVRFTNITFTEDPDSALLDCNIQVGTNKPSSVSFQPEGTNTAGDLGAALVLAYENRNLFRGSELLSIEGRVAYEAITGLEGYSDEDYQEYSIEGKLSFPRFIIPFLSQKQREQQRAHNPSSELAVSYNLQNRPEFHRRVFTTSWRYRWGNAKGTRTYRFDLLDMNYVYMPWISDTFREDYLENNESRNAILRYNYEDLFIMKIGFGMTVAHRNFTLRTNIETAGNLMHALAHATGFSKNDEGQYTLLNIAYAQYVKGDIEYTRNYDFDENNQFVIHGALGIAYPYGNSEILPYEKRYFSGGANSVRGWSVRSLGPGRFHSQDGRIDFINQTGDIRLDLSIEYRTKLFWKFNGAAFIDAGNIWTIHNYEDQPGGQFKFDEFYKQLAVAYGLGIRMNFGYFILRFDFGMKAINPDYTTTREHYPIYHPKLDRDLAVHFAVGLPF